MINIDEFPLEEEKKHYVFIGIIIVIFLLSSVIFYFFKTKVEDTPIEEVTETKQVEEVAYLKIDIKGAIKKPGVYEMEEGSRVIDVIDKAGGLKKDANTSLINLSKKVTDEMTIIIYTNEDIDEWRLTEKIKEYDTTVMEEKCPDKVNQACLNQDDEKQENKASPEEKPSIVSINSATKEQLMTLQGIGEKKAEDIIAYRNNTPFQTIDDIKNVTGIGEQLFEKIKNNITI